LVDAGRDPLLEKQNEIERGQRVLLDSELAALYGVSTRRFNEQVRRNRKRFPADFMFQLTAEETSSSRSQIATLKTGRGQHRKYLPSSQNMGPSWQRRFSTARFGLSPACRAFASVPNRPATGRSSYSSPRPSNSLSRQI